MTFYYNVNLLLLTLEFIPTMNLVLLLGSILELSKKTYWSMLTLIVTNVSQKQSGLNQFGSYGQVRSVLKGGESLVHNTFLLSRLSD